MRGPWRLRLHAARRGAGRVALAILGLAPVGCMGLAHADTQVASFDLPPSRAAAVAARFARSALPTGDPHPEHAGAPIVIRADGFTVLYRETADGWVHALGEHRIWQRRGIAGGIRTTWVERSDQGRTSCGGRDRIRVDIEGAGIGRSRVAVRGVRISPEFESRLFAELVATAQSERSSDPRDSNQPSRSNPNAASPNRDLSTRLRTRSRLHRAAQRGDDPAAQARSRLAELNSASAAIESAQREAARLATTPWDTATRARWAVRFHQLTDRRSDAAACVSSSRDRLAAGDRVGAAMWLDRASAAGLSPSQRLATQAAIAHDADSAYAVHLSRLERDGPTPAIVFALHDAALERGDSRTALRWLARYWDQFDAAERLVATARLHRLSHHLTRESGTAPDDPFARILASEGHSELGITLLATAGHPEPPFARPQPVPTRRPPGESLRNRVTLPMAASPPR